MYENSFTVLGQCYVFQVKPVGIYVNASYGQISCVSGQICETHTYDFLCDFIFGQISCVVLSLGRFLV